MLKTTLLTAALVMATSGLAQAGGQEGTIGVGAEFQMNGLVGGPSLNYDAGKFHAGAMFGFRRVDQGGQANTETDIGARFYFHIHSTAMSDFGVGGMLGIASVPVGGGMGGNPTRQTDVFLEPGFQIRLFVASNVALSFAAGLSIGLSDATTTAIAGQGIGISTSTRQSIGLDGGAGVHYYFF